MSRRLRVAQLSFWFVHADGFCARALLRDDIELAAVWDTDADRGRSKAEAFDAPFVADLDELLSDDSIDAVLICAEPHLHPELVARSTEAGKHVLVEKPMAADLAGAKEIAEAAERAASKGVQVMPAYNLRFHPVAQYVEELVSSGALGEILRVRYLHGHYREYESAGFRADEITATWGDPIEERRDSLFYAGSHVTLWFEWVFGLPISVMSMCSFGVPELPVEDNSTTLLRYDGFHGSMEVSETLSAQSSVTEIYGTEGVVVQQRGNLPSTRVSNPTHVPVAVFSRAADEWRYPDFPPSFARHEEAFSSVDQFFGALLDGRPVPTTASSGLSSIAILAAAEQSAREGREVALADILLPAGALPA